MITIEVLKEWEYVAGLIVTVFGLISAGLVWLHKRQRSVAAKVTDDAIAPLRGTADRLSAVEIAVRGLDEDVDRLANRVGGIERNMEGLAKAAELSKVQSDIAGITAHVKAIGGQLDTLYEAALRASMTKE